MSRSFLGLRPPRPVDDRRVQASVDAWTRSLVLANLEFADATDGIMDELAAAREGIRFVQDYDGIPVVA